MAQQQEDQLNRDELYRLMQDRGLSNKQLAGMAEVNEKTVDDWLSGKRQPHRGTLNLVAAVFRVPASSLMRNASRRVADPEGKLPEALRRYLCSFDPFIKERTLSFTGRKFIFDRLDAFLADPDVRSGYFLIRGDPGIGKSAFIARLVSHRKLPVYHFNIGVQGINKTSQCLANICVQLVSHFDLPHASFPDGFDQDGMFLNNLLQEAASRLKGNESLVVAIDALDEIDPETMPRTGNPCFLPLSLPERVYFILTSRNRDGIVVQADNVFVLSLDAAGELAELNRADAREFIANHLARDGIRKWLLARELSDEVFVTQLTEKSEGNFMYLRHVLPAIEKGRFTDQGVADLPHGLREYYHRHWIQMRDHDPDVFDRLYQPVVCILAAAFEPAAIHQLVVWTGLESSAVRRVIRDWAEFLSCERREGGERTYRLYHGAFREFLDEEINK